MYRCVYCDNLFEEGEQKEINESRGEHFGFPAYEAIAGCPICGSPYEEVSPCDLCHGYTKKKGSESICEDCGSELFVRFKALMDEHFTMEERKALNEILDGEEL